MVEITFVHTHVARLVVASRVFWKLGVKMVIWDLYLQTERGWSRIGRRKKLTCDEGSVKPLPTRRKISSRQKWQAVQAPPRLVTWHGLLPKGLDLRLKRQFPAVKAGPELADSWRLSADSTSCSWDTALPWRGSWVVTLSAYHTSKPLPT